MFHGDFRPYFTPLNIGVTLSLIINSNGGNMGRKITTGVLAGLNPKEANFVIEYTKDFSPRRAAEASGYSPDSGYNVRNKPEVSEAIDRILLERLSVSDIDAEWVLMEAVDNVLIAKQHGNISASNTALGIVAKHVLVDAFAADKVNVTSTSDIVERLQRARDRMQDEPGDDVSFM